MPVEPQSATSSQPDAAPATTSTNNDAQEKLHYTKVLNAYQNYLSHSLASHRKRKRDFSSLPARHRAILSPKWEEKWDLINTCIRVNGAFIEHLIAGQEDMMDFDSVDHEVAATHDDHHAAHSHASHDNNRDSHTAAVSDHSHTHADNGHSHADNGHSHDHAAANATSSHAHKQGQNKTKSSESDMDKVRSTIRQFVRDWSDEGKAERDAVYTPMIQALCKAFEHVPVSQRGAVSVLVPGAGLGRLAFDVAKEGFSCQGNEFSFYMLIASNFVLNRLYSNYQYTIYPWVHSLSNSTSATNQLAPVRIPDVLPGGIPEGADFSMVAGDFVEVYSEPDQLGSWNAILTCFFLDTAHNIVHYIEVISGLLAPGGIWINCGPLLYHFEGMPGEVSLELSLEEVMSVIKQYGFDIIEEKFLPSTYASNVNSMLRYQYNNSFFVAIKHKPQE
ncbi:carnosine N-methyltransferase [Synchytrium microbalum]|uniref:carnosine N-methyltransferase n=1 Tax=Synchytrium microbalum TaxID=1806994 RepID=A0A507BKW5_9FUNG|nr:carnosine N-methyltransferase [Synchytrium microbalum]TPX30437.1 carnosine N-methyltransferase [Synchytrium microbalum]